MRERIAFDLSGLEERLAGIRASARVHQIIFSPEEDKLLLKYWPVKNHADIAKEWGISTSTLLKRYRELTEEKR